MWQQQRPGGGDELDLFEELQSACVGQSSTSLGNTVQNDAGPRSRKILIIMVRSLGFFLNTKGNHLKTKHKNSLTMTVLLKRAAGKSRQDTAFHARQVR